MIYWAACTVCIYYTAEESYAALNVYCKNFLCLTILWLAACCRLSQSLVTCDQFAEQTTISKIYRLKRWRGKVFLHQQLGSNICTKAESFWEANSMPSWSRDYPLYMESRSSLLCLQEFIRVSILTHVNSVHSLHLCSHVLSTHLRLYLQIDLFPSEFFLSLNQHLSHRVILPWVI